jgi:hypothetical protein
MQIPDAMVSIVGAFAPVFSDRVWQHAQVLLLGALLARGKRTVASILRAVGRSDEEHYTNYHRVLNRASWSSLQASRILLGLIVAVLLVSGAPLIVGADDTIERRSGRKIRARGCYRDAVRSSHKHVIRCFGLKWVSMMALVRVPWSSRVWALPFLTALCWPEKSHQKGKRKHKTSVDLVRQMMKVVRRWVPDRMVVLVLDGGFAAVALALACSGYGVVMVCRLRLDARLYHKPGPQPKGKRGRKPLKGARQRTLRQWATRSDTPWERVEVDWYGGTRRTVDLFSRTALWHTPGSRPVEIRYVLVRDPEGELRTEAFFSTKLDATPEQIISWFVMRWSVEVTFEEAREHLGLETQRQWSDLAIARTTPSLLALFSIGTLTTIRLHEAGELVAATSAWYDKPEPTFSDCIALVRRHIWRSIYLNNSVRIQEFVQLPREEFDRIIDGLLAAA